MIYNKLKYMKNKNKIMRLIFKITKFKYTIPLIVLVSIVDYLANKYNKELLENITNYSFFIISFCISLRLFIWAKALSNRLYRLLFKTSLLLILVIFVIVLMLPTEMNLLLYDIIILVFSILILISSFNILLFIFMFLKNNIKNIHPFLKKFKYIQIIIFLNMIAIIFGFLYFNSKFIKISNRVINLENKFGGTEKASCSDQKVKNEISNQVLRIIGSYGEGSGFPISLDSVITNFHVIEGESSPKVVFPDGSIETPINIKADKNKDFAVLKLKRKLDSPYFFNFDASKNYGGLMLGEPLYSFGYPLGSEIKGDPAILKGSFAGMRWLNRVNMNVIESNISVVEGMSGGPLVDSCGEVVGINTLGIGGLSMFLDLQGVLNSYQDMTEEAVTKIKIDTSSPIGVVEAFYTYIKTRNLENAFSLFSKERKSSVKSFENWMNGYNNTLQVDLVFTKTYDNDKNRVDIRMQSQDWVAGDLVYKYFEGTWNIIEEDGEYKLDESNIKQVDEPPYWWFYTWDKPDWAK